MTLLEFVNALIPLAGSDSSKNLRLQDEDQTFTDAGLDSLDYFVLMLYIFEIYGIDEDPNETVRPRNVLELEAYLERKRPGTPVPHEALRHLLRSEEAR